MQAGTLTAAAHTAPRRLVVFAAGDDSTLLMLTLEKGEPFDKPMRPKNASRPLARALLDVIGTLVPSPLGEEAALVSAAQ